MKNAWEGKSRTGAVEENLAELPPCVAHWLNFPLGLIPQVTLTVPQLPIVGSLLTISPP